MSSAKGRFIRWNWQQQKYVWVSKEELRAKAAKGQNLEPSPYLKERNNKPAGVKAPCRAPVKRPLKVYKKEKAPQAKRPKVTKSAKRPKVTKSSKRPKVTKSARSNQKKRRPNPKQDKSEKMADKRSDRDETDAANPPSELLQGHDTFMAVMTNRLIHQGAALTFWRQSPNALVSYLVRTNDDAVTVDVLPTLTESFSGLKSSNSELSMGACVDLMPTLRRLLDSKFEDYIKSSLDFIRTMVRFYSKDLQTMKNAHVSNLQKSQSLYGIYMGVVAMTDKLDKLARRKDSVGQKAVIVAELVHKL